MGSKLKLNDTEYDIENLNDQQKSMVTMLKFANNRIQELDDIQALLQRAKKSYVDSLKTEMLSKKAGILLGDD